MERTNLNASFIPKRPSDRVSRPVYRNHFNILMMIGIWVFVLSVILAVSIFLYQKSLVKKLQLSNEKLLAVKGSLDPDFVGELLTLDKRLKTSTDLLMSHQTVSPIFSILESETLERVRFKTFRYNADIDGILSISVVGEADSFNAIALQSDIFGSSSQIGDPVFRNFVINDSGNVDFDFSGVLDSNAFLYRKVLQNTPKSSVGTTTDSTTDSSLDDNSLINDNSNNNPVDDLLESDGDDPFNNLPEF